MARAAGSPSRPTINDVARLAGVSKGAVSRSFNGGTGLPIATVDRIKAVAASIGWSPSAAARAINGARAMMAGFIINRGPDLLALDPFFASLISGLQRVFQENSYSMVLTFVSSVAEELRAYERFIAENRVDGFIVADVRPGDPRLDLLERRGAHAVLVSDQVEGKDFPGVFIDGAECEVELFEGWIARGLRRIGHVAGPLDLLGASGRRDLWASVLQRHGLTADLLAVGNYRAADAPAATRDLMARKDPPQAIFYGSDVMAIAGMRTLFELGYSVPDDVAVAGFDGIELSMHVRPVLTTVECDYVGLGETVARTLLKQVRGEDTEPRLALPATLRIRESS